MGIRRILRPVDHVCEFNGVGERFRHQPWGIFGGEAGAVGAFRIETDSGDVRSLASKASRVLLKPSERVVLDTPGACGYGPPAERTEDAIREDLESGKFSAPFMTRHYGDRGNSGN